MRVRTWVLLTAAVIAFGAITAVVALPPVRAAATHDRYTGPWNRRTSAPILVVNSRYDPATPLRGAQDATAELGNAGLLIVEGGGHTGMFVPSTCGERAKREYLFTGVLPALRHHMRCRQ